jgi:hypothetical protein
MITLDFITWLGDQEWGEESLAIYQGPVGPESEPRRHLVVTPVPGGGMQADGRIEQRVFMVKTVGPMGLSSTNWNTVFAQAEELAQLVDRTIMNAFRPVIGGEQVVYMSRFGSLRRQGGPSGQPLDKANRPSFQTMYVVEATSSIYDD